MGGGEGRRGREEGIGGGEGKGEVAVTAKRREERAKKISIDL